MSELVIPG